MAGGNDEGQMTKDERNPNDEVPKGALVRFVLVLVVLLVIGPAALPLATAGTPTSRFLSCDNPGHSRFGFRVSAFGLLSDFGFRTSDLGFLAFPPMLCLID
jgi:hypothetical protein